MQVASKKLRELYFKKKRIIYPLFFCTAYLVLLLNSAWATINYNSSNSVKLNKALNERLYEDPQWLALLHLYKGSPDINDSDFYINHIFSNARDEFIISFSTFFESNIQKEKCRFPARFFWLVNKLKITENNTLGTCPNYENYIEKVPLETVSLVFGAEDIAIPASMMGHVFLKLSGKDHDGNRIDHAISFYTNTKDVSFIGLLLKSFVTGMKGYYTLTPYQFYKNTYLYNEQRNVWEYSLKLDSAQIELLKNHLYELKNIKFKYLFHYYNCATFIHGVLNILYPEINSTRSSWVTPLDVVRGVYDNKLTNLITVFPSSKWKIAALQDVFKINYNDINQIKNQRYGNLNLDKMTYEQKISTLELAKAYNHYLSEENIINRDKWAEQEKIILDKKEEFSKGSELDLSEYKLPHKTIKSTQIILALDSRNDEKILRIGYLPLSHSLADDNSQYISESALKIGEIYFAYNRNSKIIKLDELNLYSLAAFNPANALLGTISWKFNIGYGPRIQIENQFENVYFIEGALGRTFRLVNDLDLYGFINLAANDKKTFNFNLGPELGFIIREVKSMKSIISFNRDFNIIAKKSINEMSFTQAINFTNHAFNLIYNNYGIDHIGINRFSFVYKYLY
jgi:hypothetical protein